MDSPYLDVAVYQNIFFHVDQFYEDSARCEEADGNSNKGLLMILERKWDQYKEMK